jgi:thiamine biosynthesis lipoprotein
MNRAFRLAVLLLAGLAAGAEPAAVEWRAMGTRVRLQVRGADAEAAAPAMATAARAALEAVEAETSAFRATSAVARVSAAAGSGEWISVGPAFEAAMDVALDVAGKSGGAFNPLVAPLMAANGFDRGSGVAGSVDRALLDLSGVERRPGACRLAAPGMALDLGGVAKGVGADRAAAAARAAATNEFLLDVGGMLVGRGAWTVGVRDPRGAADAPPVRVVPLADGVAAATSGRYERGDHILDPRTGLPTEGGALQVTVLAPTASEADAWSTALFVLVPEAGRRALAGRRGIDALWILSDSPDAIRRPALRGEIVRLVLEHPVAQGLGLIALILTCLSYQARTTRGIALRQAVASFFWTTHLLLLGAWTGGLLNLLGLARGSVYSQRGARAWASRPLWPWLFGALCVAAAFWSGLVQGEGPRLLLSTAAQCLGCYALWTVRVRLARLLLVVVSLLWLVYDVLSGSIPGTACEVFSQISLYIAIARDLGKMRRVVPENGAAGPSAEEGPRLGGRGR